MVKQNGIFIVLEGIDGSGKGTQFKLLSERLRAVGYEVEVFDFPRYHKTSSHFVRRYLNGEYGPAKEISPYAASLFFALDRYEAAPTIKKALQAGKIVLANRYVGSNMAHQGGKFNNPMEQRGFFVWEDGLEFQMLGIPRPDFNFFLRVPAEIAYRLIAQKNERQYTKATHDEHEKDVDHLRSSVATYDMLCQLFPKDFTTIECTQDGKMLSVAQINDKIWEQLKPMLPKKPQHAAKDVVVQLSERPEKIKEDLKSNTSTQYQKPQATNLVSGKEIKLNIKKVSLLAISSIQLALDVQCELTGLEWPDEGNYNFYTPSNLSKKMVAIYKESMQKQAKLHTQMLDDLRKEGKAYEILKATTPLATLASARISAGAKALQRLIVQLQASPLEEVRWLSQQLAAAIKKIYPHDFNKVFVEQPFTADSTYTPLNDVIAKLVSDHLPHNLPASTETLSLLEVHPRNEFDLLRDSFYSYSSASGTELTSEIEKWTYEHKQEALTAAMAHPENLPLKQATYLWNLICDRTAFEHLHKVLVVTDLQQQPPTPRYGYSVVEAIEQSMIDTAYVECFDESLKLYSALQAAEIESAAPYATLLGHKNRWQFSNTAEALMSAHSPSDPIVSEILNMMHEKVNEVHPLIGEFIGRKTMKQDQPTPINKLGAEKPRAQTKKDIKKSKNK